MIERFVPLVCLIANNRCSGKTEDFENLQNDAGALGRDPGVKQKDEPQQTKARFYPSQLSKDEGRRQVILRNVLADIMISFLGSGPAKSLDLDA